MATTKSRDCAVCFEPYKKPRFLPCHHSLCELCILDLVESKQIQPGEKFGCPECRQQHVWTRNWQQRFPSNFYLQTGETRPQEEQKCPRHNKRLSLFCDDKDCKVYICHGCFLSEHRDHVIQDGADVVRREHFREKLRENLTRVEKTLQYLQEVEQAQNTEELQEKEQKCLCKLNQQVDLAVKKLQEAAQEYERVIKENTQKEKERLQNIQHRQTELAKHAATLQETVGNDSVLENEEDKVKEILSRSSALCCLTDVELRMKSRCIQLCCPDLEQDEARANFLERALGSVTTSNEEVTMAAHLLIPEANYVQIRDVTSWQTGCESEQPMRVNLTKHGTILICQIVPRLVGSDTVLKAFSTDGALQHTMTLPERRTKSWLCSLVDVDGTHAAVAYNDTEGVEKIDVSRKPFSITEWIKSYILEPLPTQYYCRGQKHKPKRMCYGPPGFMLLVDETCSVNVLDISVQPWRQTRSIEVSHHFNVGVSGLGCLALPSGHVVIVSFFPYYTHGGAIKAVDFDTGKELWSVSGFIDGELCCPWGISSDDEGRIFVADGWNKRVLVLTIAGDFLQTLKCLVPNMYDVFWVGWSDVSNRLFVLHKTQEDKGLAAVTSCELLSN